MSFNGGILLGSIAEMRRGEGTVVRVRKHGVAALFAATGVAAGIMAAPIAVADTCDPAVAVCQGGAVVPDNTSSPDYSTTATGTSTPPGVAQSCNPRTRPAQAAGRAEAAGRAAGADTVSGQKPALSSHHKLFR
jgi:hypothetical protein